MLSSLKGEVLRNEPLKRHTYYRIGGPAAFVLTPRGEHDLEIVSRFIFESKLPVTFLGKGSNILASDEGYDGVVLKTTKLNEVMRVSGDLLETGASVPISVLLKRCGEEGWGGLEFLTGVPGSVGGVIAMNAGTHLGEASSRIETVVLKSLSHGKVITKTLSKTDLKFSYRKNEFMSSHDLVFSCVWKITHANPQQVQSLISETLSRRKSTQPIDKPSCGSVFKNPSSDLHAWQVIDKIGLRGHQQGDAQFSEKHCNFIINKGQAKASDVKTLIDLAKTKALTELGVQLEEEVKYLGNFTELSD